MSEPLEETRNNPYLQSRKERMEIFITPQMLKAAIRSGDEDHLSSIFTEDVLLDLNSCELIETLARTMDNLEFESLTFTRREWILSWSVESEERQWNNYHTIYMELSFVEGLIMVTDFSLMEEDFEDYSGDIDVLEDCPNELCNQISCGGPMPYLGH